MNKLSSFSSIQRIAYVTGGECVSILLSGCMRTSIKVAPQVMTCPFVQEDRSFYMHLYNRTLWCGFANFNEVII